MYSSGTGGAGIAGSLSFLALSTWFQLSADRCLLIVAPVPLLMALFYFFVLKLPIIKLKVEIEEEVNNVTQTNTLTELQQPQRLTIMEKIKLQKRLARYTGPLFLVYFAEYVINQAIFPVMKFPSDSMFDGKEYEYYQFLYQVGVFISRSSVNFFQIKYLWCIAFWQVVNMFFLGTVAYFNFIPSIWIIFVIIIYEGLLGGALFVNAFYLVAEEVEDNLKEFCMSSISFWYSVGILAAGATGIGVQKWLESVRPPPAPAPTPVPAPSPSPSPSPSLSPSPSPTL